MIIASSGAMAFTSYFFFLGLLSLLKAAGGLVFWVLLVRAILSWVSQGRSPIEYVFHQITEPMLAPVRRILPDMGGFDLSVLVVFIVLQFANFLMGDFVGPIWYKL
jgi:YggT family protein